MQEEQNEIERDAKMGKGLRLKYFPISSFSIILGLTGITIMFQKAESYLDIPGETSSGLLMASCIVFVLISVIYLVKIIRYPAEVRAEFAHPIKLSFFPAFSISLLLFSIAFLDIATSISYFLWVTGSAIHLIFTIGILSIWMQHTKFELHHINPSWFIPVVGNLLVPVAGVIHCSKEISWFFFSIGLIFWIMLFMIFFYRIIFHHPLPEKLVPTFFILIAPPAVGFISYVKLTGEVDAFARILYYTAIFMVVLLFSQAKMFYRVRFSLSWWAYSFPISAVTIASILMFHKTGDPLFETLAYSLFSLLCLIIGILIVKTLAATFRREICIEEKEIGISDAHEAQPEMVKA